MSRELITNDIEQRVFTFRNTQVMVDRDLAELYHVETKVLNQAVKRNIARFPIEFRFQLSDNEFIELVTNCDRFHSLKHSTSKSYVFTEQGIAMLSAILRSDIAIKVSVQIMNAFVVMRRQLHNNQLLVSRIEKIEGQQQVTDQKLDHIFNALESKLPEKEKGVFFDGQMFDAYTFVSDVIRKATQSIVLIDNYIDDTVLTLLSKRKQGVKCTIFTKTITKQLKLDLQKHNEQYPEIKVIVFKEAHDRFLLLDDLELYHIGASIKDVGKKWFAFSKMNTETVNVLNNLKLLGYE